MNKERSDKVGFKIKEYREEKKMSQSELARISNVSRTTINGLENGTIKVTTTETLLKIAEALEKKVTEIFLE